MTELNAMIERRNKHLSELFERIACLQATSEYSCGEGLEWKKNYTDIQIHGFITSVGMEVLNEEVDGNMLYDDAHNLGLMVY